MKRTQAIRYLSLFLFGWFALAAQARADASPVNTQEWGVYASLAGTSWRGGYGLGQVEWDVSVEWREVGVELVERWEPSKKGYAPMTHVITRGEKPGELRLAATNGVCASRTGTVRPDGTVLFVCDGFFKWPVHVVAPQAGVWEQRYVKLDGGEIAGVKDTWRFLPAPGGKEPALAAAVPTQGPAKTPVEASQEAKTSPAVPATEPASPLAADWGVYAAIVDKDWRGASNVSIRWNKPGEELVETWTYGIERGERAGEQQLVAIIRRGEKPGSLVVTLEDGEIAGTRTLVGKVREDGSVQFSRPGFLLGMPVYRVSLPGPSRLEYASYPHAYPPGNPPGNQKGTTVYLAQGGDERRGSRERLTETWGAYADLAGKHWRLIDDDRELLFTFGWIVPGEAMYVRMHNFAYDRVENHHVVRSPETGKLYAEPSLWGAWKAEVTLDGDRSIKLETKGMLAWRMSFTRKADGGYEYHEDGSLYKAYTGSMVAVSDKEAPRLIAAAKEAKVQREREKQQRKRERREAFNSAMMVANAALTATSETLAQQQAEADAAQRRYQTAVMEQNRVAAEREEAEAERKYQADWQHAKQVLAEQEKAREARAEASRAAADRRQESVAQSAQQQQQQQRRAEDARRREAAETELKRKQEADAERRRREEIARRERAEREALARSKQLEDALKRQEEEARNRPVAYREGITLCAPPKDGGKAWLCRGPLQNMSGVLDTQSGNVAVREACGGNNIRDLGMVAGYRAYGCGYGIHPTDRDAPNRDVPASLGVNHVPGRGVFHCNPTKVFSYCKERR